MLAQAGTNASIGDVRAGGDAYRSPISAIEEFERPIVGPGLRRDDDDGMTVEIG